MERPEDVGVFQMDISQETASQDNSNLPRDDNSAQLPPNSEIARDKATILTILESFSCYEVIPESGKIVIIDTEISIKNAFFALMENDIRCAPLWDSTRKEFIGMITMTNFINTLCSLYQREDKSQIAKELEGKKILNTYSESITEPRFSNLITISPDDSLRAACDILVNKNIHRIPLVDPTDHSIIHIVTHIKIIRFLMTKMPEPRPALFNKTIGELGIGTFVNVVTRPLGTKLIDLFNLMNETGYSAIPIVHEDGTLYDVYSKGDVPSLAIHRTYTQLDRPIEEVIAESRSKKNINTCTSASTLSEVLNTLISMKAHRVFCVDESLRIQGIISLIDILKFFLDSSK